MRERIQHWYEELHALRTDQRKPRDLSFREFLARQGKAPNGDETLTPEHIFAEFGWDASTVTFKELHDHRQGFYVLCEIVRDAVDRGMHGMTLRQQLAKEQLLKAVYSQAPVTTDPASRYITPELYTAPIMRGVVQGQYWDALVSADLTVAQPKVTMPLMSLSEANLKETAEAATIEEGIVTYSSKDVNIKKRGRGIRFSDESVMFNTIDLVSIFFEDLGRILASSLNGEAVRVLRDGDQAGGSEAALVIGVSSANTFDYTDVIRVMIRMGMIGRPVTQVLAGEDMSNAWENLSEVKNNQQSGPKLLPTITRGVVRPQNWELFPAFNIPANKILFNDPNSAMVALTAKPLVLEGERIVSRQLNGAFATIYKGFAIQQTTGRVIVDKSIAFAGNGWSAAFSGNQETW